MAQRIRLTKEKKEKFLNHVKRTCNVSAAAKASGITRHAWYDARDKNASFAAAWDEAVEIGIDALEKEARRRAYTGVQEPVFYQGKICGGVRKYSDTLLIFLLKGHRPSKYADLHRVEGGNKPIKIEIVKFSDDGNQNPK